MELGDDIAISKARRGDRDAFRVLVERHAKAVFRLAYRMTNSETDAEDMVQETFLRAWKQIAKFDGRATFGTWLHRICANCTLDDLRVRQRRKELQPAYQAGEEQNEPATMVAAGGPSPERLEVSSEVAAR